MFLRELQDCQTFDADNFAKLFTGLKLLNIALMLDGVLSLSLHLPDEHCAS